MINLEWKTAWVNTEALRFRDGPGLGYNVIQWLTSNQEITAAPEISVNDGKIVWWLANVGGRFGFVASGYLSLTRPQPVPVPNPVPPKLIPRPEKLIGLHVLDGPNNGEVERILAGHAVGAVTVVNDIGLANRIKSRQPGTEVIFRQVNGVNDPAPTGGKARWDELWPTTSQLRPDVWIQIANEWYSGGWNAIEVGRFANIYLDAMDSAVQAGRKIVVGDFQMGSPEPYHLKALGRLFERAASLGWPVNYHAYNPLNSREIDDQAEWYAMRWLKIAERWPALKFIFGECGMGDANWLGAAHFIQQVTKFEGMLAPYRDRVLGAAWWTAGGQPSGWARSSVDEGLADYERWLG